MFIPITITFDVTLVTPARLVAIHVYGPLSRPLRDGTTNVDPPSCANKLFLFHAMLGVGSPLTLQVSVSWLPGIDVTLVPIVVSIGLFSVTLRILNLYRIFGFTGSGLKNNSRWKKRDWKKLWVNGKVI